MKKFFVLFVLLAFTATFSFGFNPETRVANMVEKAKPVNKMAGIQDLNRIWPGQIVWVPVEVKPGDTYWWICRDIAYPPYYSEPQAQSEPTKISATPVLIEDEPVSLWGYLHRIGLILLIVFLLVMISKMIYNYLKSQKDKKQDPVTAGPAQVPGGVNDQNAHNRMIQIALQRFPGARINIQNIRRGTLSGRALIHYAEGKPKKLNLNNVIAYAGEVMVNNQLETIYFLQGCGNDARQGNYMSGNELVFTSDAEINRDGSEVSIQQEKVNDEAVSKEETREIKEKIQEKDLIKIQTNESTKIISDCLGLVSNTFLEKQHAHEVTIEFFNPENGVQVAKATLKTKNTNEQKKDEAK